MAVAPQVASHRPSVGATALSSKFALSQTSNCLGFDLLIKPPTPRGVGRRARDRASRRLCSVPGPVAALGGLLGGIFGTGTDTGESTRQLYASTVALINQMESEISSLSDSQLRERTSALQERARSGDSLDSLLPVCPLIFNLTNSYSCLLFAMILFPSM